MPPLLPPEYIESISEETKKFTQHFSEKAAGCLPPEAQDAVARFIQAVEAGIADFCKVPSKGGEIQTAKVFLHFPCFLTTLEQNIFNSETYPLWQNYIESLLLQLEPHVADKEPLNELLNCISGRYARICWLDLCVIHMHQLRQAHQTDQEFSQRFNVSTHKDLLLDYFSGNLSDLFIENVTTNFCLHYFNIVLHAASREQCADRYSTCLPEEPYVRILRQIANSILACSEDPLHDDRLAQALMHLSHCSSHPSAIQRFLRSRSIFLFSPIFFLDLLTVDADSAAKLVDIAFRTENTDVLEFSLDLLLAWLQPLATLEAQRMLISSLRELSNHEKLRLANLSFTASTHLLALFEAADDPVSDLATFLSIASQHPNFLAIVEGVFNTLEDADGKPDEDEDADADADASIIRLLSALFSLIIALHRKHYLCPQHFTDIQDLLRQAKPPVSKSLFPYLRALSQTQYQSQESIDFFFSLARKANSPDDFEMLNRLQVIFTRIPSLNLDGIIDVVSDRKIKTFKEKFKKNRELDELSQLMTFYIKIHWSAESIKQMIANPQQMQDVKNMLSDLNRALTFTWGKRFSILRNGLPHLQKIGVPFEEIFAFLSKDLLRFIEHRVIVHVLETTLPQILDLASLLNSPLDVHQTTSDETLKSIIQGLALASSEEWLNPHLRLAELLLSFALGAKIEEAFEDRSDTNPVSPSEYTDFVINTIESYFTKFQAVLDHMRNIFDERIELVKSRLYTLFARVIQQEATHPDFLMEEANRVSDAIKMLRENTAPSSDTAEPLPLLLLRAVVYEHSLLLFRRKTQKPQSTPVSSEAAAQAETQATPALHAQFVCSVFSTPRSQHATAVRSVRAKPAATMDF